MHICECDANLSNEYSRKCCRFLRKISKRVIQKGNQDIVPMKQHFRIVREDKGFVPSTFLHFGGDISVYFITFNNLFGLHITKTCLYNFDPLKPHFCIVKLGFTGVYIIFLFLI